MTAYEAMASRRALLTGALGVGALGGVGLAPGSAEAAKVGDPAIPEDTGQTYLIKIAGAPGDSGLARYADWFRLLTFSWGVSNTGSAFGGGAGDGKAKPAPLMGAAYSGIQSPKLFESAATGKTLRSAELIVLTSSEEPQVYYRLKLEEVLVSSFRSTQHPVDGYPLDVFDLDYRRFSQSIYQQRDDGSYGDPVTFSYDYARGRSV